MSTQRAFLTYIWFSHKFHSLQGLGFRFFSTLAKIQFIKACELMIMAPNLKIKKRNIYIFKIIHFVNVETDLRLWYTKSIILSLLFFRRDIHGYKAPSIYT
jgi:hypothetical protein